MSKLFRTPIGYAHWCEGCRCMHEFNTDRPIPEKRWTFDGNLQAPTFKASMRVFMPAHKSDEGQDRPERTLCHYHVEKGVVRYLDDSHGHALRGKHAMLDVPESYGVPESWKPIA